MSSSERDEAQHRTSNGHLRRFRRNFSPDRWPTERPSVVFATTTTQAPAAELPGDVKRIETPSPVRARRQTRSTCSSPRT